MSRDPRTPQRGDPPDDAVIEQLVRDVAAEWAMPPLRLDAPGWRERIRTGRGGRVAAAGGWVRRIGQAATAAVALTVAAALVAVVLTRPPLVPGKSPEPGAPSDGPTPAAQASLLPKLLVDGAAPTPSTVLVQTEPGDFGLVDLEKGTIQGGLTGARFGSDLRVLADGTMVCLCLFESENEDGRPTHAEIRLERYDTAGKRQSSVTVATFDGEPDPRDAGVFVPERPGHLATALQLGSDDRFGFVGFSVRDHPAWRSRILAVDLTDGRVVDLLELPDADTGDGDSRRFVDAPRVVGTTGDGGVLLARGWYAWSPARSESAVYTSGTDVYQARVVEGAWSGLAPLDLAQDCGDRVVHGGALPDGGTWLACAHGISATTILRRVAGSGDLLPDVRVPGGDGIEGDVTTVGRDGRHLFVWDPATGVLTKVDIAAGTTTRGEGFTARADGGPLAAFGSWLAPSTAAKSFLRGSVVLSPDGTRVYAIGIKASVDPADPSGSAGVFVFDAVTLERVGEIWQPTADFVSLALSGDGRFAYAAGMPGVDETGQRRSGQLASITVFDTADGSVRVIAGQLAGGMLTFTAPTLD